MPALAHPTRLPNLGRWPALRVRAWLAALLCLWSLGLQAATSERAAKADIRVALVIGNAAYRDAPLLNPVNDAKAMAAALREAGFDVKLHTDIDQRAMAAALREFGDKLRRSSVGIFYFAGHGMQIKGRNYLVPVNAEIQREDEVAYGTLDAQAVLDKMDSAGNGLNLMILDACRNNPFARSFRSAAQGLAQMDAPVGTLVAFATAPGSVASDGQGQHGLYTQHLLQEMRKPGAKVEEVFKRVRAAVRRDSAGKQVPWEATSLEGDLSFFTSPATAPAPAVAQKPPAPAGVTAAAPAAAGPALVPVATAASAPTVIRPVVQVTAPLPTPVAAAEDEHDRRTAELLAELAQPARAPVTDNAARAPRAAAPARTATGYTLGDRWNYQVVDKQRGEVVRNYTVRVDKLLPGGRWSTGINVIYDAYGRLVESSPTNGDTRRYTPHALRWWPEMSVGEQRSVDLEMERTPPGGTTALQKVSSDSRVVAQETVRVPAGEFKVLRIEHKGFTRNVGSYGAGSFTHTIWYSPELRNAVAQEVRSHWNGQQDTNIREELTSYTVASPAR